SKLPDTSACTLGDGTPPDLAANYTSSCDVAKQYASKNIPWSPYGMVLRGSDVVVGRWDCGGLDPSASCFTSVAVGTDCTVPPVCNAVRVTTKFAVANNNPLTLAFSSLVGYGSMDITATAIGVYGNAGVAGAQARWNIMLVQDITTSI